MALKLSKEFKVGLFTLLAGLMLYFGVNFLKGTDFLSSNNKYYAVYNDIGGMVVSNPVHINGFSVGRIKAIQILPNTKNRILVTLEVDDDIPLYRGTKAVLSSTDFLGGKAVVLEVPAPNGNVLAHKDTVLGTVEKGIVEEVTQKVQPMLANLDTVSLELKTLLRTFKGTTRVLEGTMGSFKNTSNELNSVLASNAPQIKGITSNLQSLTASLGGTQKELNHMIASYSAVGDTLAKAKLTQTVNSIGTTMASIDRMVTDMNQGKGSMGKLINSDSLYNNLNASTASLDALLKDMKDRPKRYVHFSLFGKKKE